MSFCRWSDDDIRCDLYVYQDVGGAYVIHVRKKRPVFAGPLPDPLPMSAGVNAMQIIERSEKVRGLISRYEPIDGGYDGKTVVEHTANEAVDRLYELASSGYRFPQHVIDEIISGEA